MKLRLRAPASLRNQLMLGILVPVVIFLVVNAVVLYRQALRSADTAYDRTLLATAKAIGEELEVIPGGDGGFRLMGSLTYSALEAFEADNRSRIYYRVTGFSGEMVSGFPDLPVWTGRIPARTLYAALVDFYDAEYQGVPVRVAVLLQPVAGASGQGMATIQVAETLELRETLARQILVDTLWRQAALIALIGLVVFLVVQHATSPVRRLSDALNQRPENDLQPFDTSDAPLELKPLLVATNQHMAKLSHLLEHQKRFVRDSSHQLKTPLAVLRTQLQSALRGDVDPTIALQEMMHTVQGATELANQMLALAKVEQLRNQTDVPVVNWAEAVRTVALDVSALVVDKQLDFDLNIQPVWVRAHEWTLKELARNMLHNAIRHTPEGGELHITLEQDAETGQGCLTIQDSGPGISAELKDRLFQPFATASGAPHGAGLGLSICHSIVQTLGGQIDLRNRKDTDPASTGLRATVCLPLAEAHSTMT